jgi:hypothetical protein
LIVSHIKNISPHISLILGISLILDIIVKILLFEDFIYLIRHIKSFRTGSGIEIALILLALELIGSILLLWRFKIYLVSIGMCILEGLMMYIIFSAIINTRYFFYENIFNNIFFSKAMFVAQLIYFNLAGLLAFINAESSLLKDKKNIFIAIFGVLVIAYLECELVRPVYQITKNNQGLSIMKSKDFQMLLRNRDDLRSDCNKMIIYINLSDFNCITCMDNILHLNSLLSSELNYHKGCIIGFVGPIKNKDSLLILRINNWKNAFNICFPIKPYFIEEEYSLRSSVYVVGSSGEIFSEQFPIDIDKQKIIIYAWLKNDKNY